MSILGKNLFQSNRSSLTCTYKCGNACAGEAPNHSDNAYFGDIMSRRGALKVMGAGAVTIGGGAALAACGSDSDSEAASTVGETATSTNQVTETSASAGESKKIEPVKGMQFEPVAPNKNDQITVPEGYESSVLIAWGDPVYEDAPEFDPNNQTAAAAARQFGFNNDFAGLFDHPDDEGRKVYVCSHEYSTEPQMLPNYNADDPTEEEVNIGIVSHGHTILEVSQNPETGELTREFGPLNRRITGETPMVLTGVAAGHELLQTSADPTGTKVNGTFNNCSGGVTPWGTFLSGEENIDMYWANGEAVTDERAAADLKRMGVVEGESERKWERYHDRFDLAKEPNEINRFGYLVEIDPFDPNSTPIKHTSTGRFKHEAGNIAIDKDGTVVCYSGDDQRFEYMYKFVSSEKVVEGDKAHNMTILDYGTLYVAQFEGNSPKDEITGDGDLPKDEAFDGKGKWIPLYTVTKDGSESHVDGFTAEEAAIFTRQAADEVGATKMDRPEDFEVNPVNGKVYAALTNNKYRGATGENEKKSKEDVMEYAPIRENKDGYVIEIEEESYAGTDFTWDLLLVCGDPEAASTYFAGFPKDQVSPITCPDNLAFDEHGNLWISTDSLYALDINDGLYAVGLEGENRGQTLCFLTVANGAETCGPIIKDNLVMVNVQHPGEMDDATFEEPGSHWPDGGDSLPRPAVVQVFRTDGGKIGVA
ncbi:PhoX family protein [Corynebacterium glaucum]|uniref:PhoX family protein n=1 Tax=Corynebacterium glaucum TaxID=187491 RepID=UPI0025B29666|nr:PhoX family phosphatase [Corynebacterium glaucum]WJZ06904.1 hypothetical protein CGLAUT_01990 [Corynebacterium glaucum]